MLLLAQGQTPLKEFQARMCCWGCSEKGKEAPEGADRDRPCLPPATACPLQELTPTPLSTPTLPSPSTQLAHGHTHFLPTAIRTGGSVPEEKGVAGVNAELPKSRQVG